MPLSIIKYRKKYLNVIYNTFIKHYDNLKQGDNVVFDIDGTLIYGKNPLHSIIKIYQLLLDRGCHIYIITARPENVRKYTLGQLQKHKICGFIKLIMYPSVSILKSDTTIKIFKQSARNSINNIKLSVGDRWYDLDYICENINDFSDNDSILGDGFIKIFNKE